ncbi:MAG: YbaY family lipoprotein [Burkholderiales bacterium]
MRLTERWALAGVVLGALLTGCIPAPRTVAVDPPPTMAAAAKVDAGATLTGVLTYRQRVALSKAAVAKIWLQDISRPNLPVPEILDEQVIEPAGQVPIAFRVRYDPTAIDPTHTYTLLARIYEGDRVRFTNAARYPVITGGCTVNCEIVLDMMN